QDAASDEMEMRRLARRDADFRAVLAARVPAFAEDLRGGGVGSGRDPRAHREGLLAAGEELLRLGALSLEGGQAAMVDLAPVDEDLDRPLLHEAARIDEEDADRSRNLGGARRRVARHGAGQG